MTSKERAHLRGLASQIDASVLIGQNGITENVLTQINIDLDSHELVKIGLLQNCDLKAKDIINDLAKVLDAEPIGAVGRKLVLYRYSTKAKKHVELK
ncbi:MAG: YhbY family RNA-binding protein [Clostridia bacterium]|nr:YhbY family RNA-binding protein [Clostridia bacterium]